MAQPINQFEHLASLRAIPNLNTFRPCDITETLESWQLALTSKTTPSIIILTRQNLPPIRKDFNESNLVSQGAYEIAASSSDAKVTLFASGSEVEIAILAREKLEQSDIPTRVVSIPSFELFAQQSLEYRLSIIGTAPVKIAVEAAVKLGWEQIIGESGGFIGHEQFWCKCTLQRFV